MHIAIDGPVGAGKSSYSRELSKRLGCIYIDTGAMYRAVAYAAGERGIDTSDEGAVLELMDGINMDIRHVGGTQHVFLDEHDVSDYLRTPEVSMGAASIAKIPSVRRRMVTMQQALAEGRDVIMDGRDIGTTVLPSADIKFFVTALTEVRARRRYNEMIGNGVVVDYIDVYKDVIKRDAMDKGREFEPLRKADDAIELDTSGLPFNAVIDRLMDIIKSKTDVAL